MKDDPDIAWACMVDTLEKNGFRGRGNMDKLGKRRRVEITSHLCAITRETGQDVAEAERSVGGHQCLYLVEKLLVYASCVTGISNSHEPRSTG